MNNTYNSIIALHSRKVCKSITLYLLQQAYIDLVQQCCNTWWRIFQFTLSKQIHEIGYFGSIRWQKCYVGSSTKNIKSLLSAVIDAIENNLVLIFVKVFQMFTTKIKVFILQLWWKHNKNPARVKIEEFGGKYPCKPISDLATYLEAE